MDKTIWARLFHWGRFYRDSFIDEREPKAKSPLATIIEHKGQPPRVPFRDRREKSDALAEEIEALVAELNERDEPAAAALRSTFCLHVGYRQRDRLYALGLQGFCFTGVEFRRALQRGVRFVADRVFL